MGFTVAPPNTHALFLPGLERPEDSSQPKEPDSQIASFREAPSGHSKKGDGAESIHESLDLGR